jgi:hypothetical protein
VTVAPSKGWEILRAAGIDPAPRRPGPAWRQSWAPRLPGSSPPAFLHAGTVLLKRVSVLVFIEHGIRRNGLTIAVSGSAIAVAALRSWHGPAFTAFPSPLYSFGAPTQVTGPGPRHGSGRVAWPP